MNKQWLTLLVHRDAFRMAPVAYFQALVWRLRGLKLRSRNRLAALMGRSPRAYDLWIARGEDDLKAALRDRPVTQTPEIIPVIDCRQATGSIEATLLSVADEGASHRAILLGNRSVDDFRRIESPSLLAELVQPDGSWLCILEAGDVLANDALKIYRRAAAASSDAWVIYADDDELHVGRRAAPHFKPSWNKELFEHHDYITGSAIVRATPEMVADLGQHDPVSNIVKRALERGSPVHIPAVLHHRANRPKPLEPRKPELSYGADAPLISVIVPTRNALDLLRTCIEGVQRTDYPNVELTIIDNASDDPGALEYLRWLSSSGVEILRIPGPFNFSALNNAAARQARGHLLCFLNNDIEIVDPEWLSMLVGPALRNDIGAVGARLLYPDGSVQHAGVVTGVGGGAAHAHRFQRDDDPGYFLRDRLPQRVSAVTAACLLVAKEKFLAVDGFNDRDFPVAFNDVDLCLKLNARGWQTFYEPRAVLIHHESRSRGLDSSQENRARFAEELAALKRHWGTDRIRDPYHHPQLSPFSENFYVSL